MKVPFSRSFLFASCALAFTASGAHAAIVVDTTGYTITTQCLPTEVTLGGSDADYCAGYFTNNTNPQGEEDLLNDVTDGDDWSFVYKIGTDREGDIEIEGDGLFSGIKLTLIDVSLDANSGFWTIQWEDTNGSDPLNLPLYLDLAAGFKAGTDLGFFLFDDFLLTKDPFQSSGTFDLEVNAALSHESLFVRLGTDPNGGGGGGGSVPEPGVLFLMGAGLLGLGLARRRKSA
jgi:hypothetical protein